MAGGHSQEGGGAGAAQELGVKLLLLLLLLCRCRGGGGGVEGESRAEGACRKEKKGLWVSKDAVSPRR